MGNDPWLEKALEGFHHRVVRHMAGMGPKRQQDGTWVYQPIGAALAMVGVNEIGCIFTSIATRLIMDFICCRSRIRDCDYPGDGGSILIWIS